MPTPSTRVALVSAWKIVQMPAWAGNWCSKALPDPLRGLRPLPQTKLASNQRSRDNVLELRRSSTCNPETRHGTGGIMLPIAQSPMTLSPLAAV